MEKYLKYAIIDKKYSLYIGGIAMRQDRVNRILLIPLMILLSIIPLIVRYTQILLTDPEAIEMWGSMPVGDLFSQVKAGCILTITGIICIILFLTYSKKELKIDYYMKGIYAAGGVYLFITLIATFTSQYKNTALWGVADRAEGGVILVSYVIIMLYSLYAVREVESYKYIMLALLVLTLILTVLGYYQYIGQDLFTTTEWGKALIIPEKYKEYRDSLQLLYEEKRIYGTMFHYNYIGSFTAMIIPLFVTLALYGKGWIWRTLYVVGAVCGVFLLLGSTSRAGLIGLGLSFGIGLVFLAKKMVREWKVTIALIIVSILGVFLMNQATQGGIFERIPALLKDIEIFWDFNQDEADYKEALPLQGIDHEGRALIIQVGASHLYINATEDGLQFSDDNGDRVVYDYTEGLYATQDERFNKLSFRKTDRAIQDRMVWEILAPIPVFTFVSNTEEGVHLVNPNTLEPIELEEVEYIGFEGKEKLGSARGYIWSRTLPLLKETWFIGKGPDTFVYEFPQHDYLGKWKAYDTTNMLVDKPHNLYLQIAVNQGGVALVAFLVIIGIYFVQSSKLYAFKRNDEERHIVGIAFMVAVIGYLGAGLFNDSIVSVAPIFWIVLGVGIAINYINSKMNRKQEQAMPHATIDMKKRKYIGIE